MTDYDFLAESATTPRISSISASQALRASSTQLPSASVSVAHSLPTGLELLDDALSSTPGLSSGIPRGSITEIYAPPGVGKTVFSLNIAAKVLTAREDEKVIWIDTGSPIPTPRLRDLLISNLKPTTSTNEINKEELETKLNDCMNRFIHIRAHSLPHLLSLFTHPPLTFPPKETGLIVIDTISAPYQSYFPNATELKSRLGLKPPAPQQQDQASGPGPGPAQAQAHQLQWLLNRKWNVTSDMINRISKLAASQNLAVVLLNQTHTKIKGQPRPTLYPALAGGSWETCVQNRIVLYRDHPPSHLDTDNSGSRSGVKVRYAEIMKKGGKVVGIRVEGNVFPFVIQTGGLRELHATTTTDNVQEQQQRSSPPPSQSLSLSASTSTITVRKRKVDEIADSEDEDEDEFLEGQDDDFQWDEDQDEESVPLDGKDKDIALDNN